MAIDVNSSNRMWSILVLLATLAVIAFNTLAGTGRLFDVDTGAVSDRFPTVLTPAGYAFSIWSLIYLGLLAFSIYQLLPAQLATFRGVRTIYLLSCVFNCAWLLAWHQFAIGLSVLLIFALLATLAVINLKLKDVDTGLGLVTAKGPFGLYFGWVTVASLVNVTIYLRSVGVEMSGTAWNVFAIVMILIALLAALAVRVKLRNFIYPLAIAWAFTAIAIKQTGNTAVILAAAIAVILCLVLSLSFVMDLRHMRR